MSEHCYEGWKAADGNSTGRCCCNCRWQRPIVGHPWNKRRIKQSISDRIGYGCTVPDMPSIVFFDSKHGMCEMHTRETDPSNNVLKLVKKEENV